MRRTVFFLFLYIPFFAGAQTSGYPQGYFRNPLDAPMLLAGNFGECRPGHFHSGLDIKTGGKENLPVYAAAEGYVSRIKMEPGGFGHGLYITHPNGYMTLYAHLNDFAPAIQKHVRQQQYAKESWTVDLSLSPEQFPVRKGQLIAWSGNTGGSTAPHLHFEIRDSRTEHPLNPQLFGFRVADEKPPLLRQIALYDLEGSIYNTAPKMIAVNRSGEGIRPAQDTLSIATGLAGIGVVTDDFMNGSDNLLALYTAAWYVDNTLQGRIRLDDIGYEETRYLHAYADYRTKFRKGPWVQCLFRLPGNKLERIYESLNEQRGAINLADGQYHEVRIELADVHGNLTSASFALRLLPPATAPSCTRQFYAGRNNVVEEDGIMLTLDETTLYDDVCMPVRSRPDAQSYSDRFTAGLAEVPVHHYFELQLKPNRLIPFALRSKMVMLYSDGRDERGFAASPASQGWYKASVRAFGEYRLAADTVAPVVKPLTPVSGSLAGAKSISFRATDHMTSVRNFRGELDGKWILFEQRVSSWTYLFDEHCPRGRHELVIRAADESGNTTTQRYSFIR